MTNPSYDIDAARAELFQGIVDDQGACEVLDFSKRTLDHHVANGLPFLKWRNKRGFVIARMREWILTHGYSRSREPRRPGRPARR